jgi:hypothetical protein
MNYVRNQKYFKKSKAGLLILGIIVGIFVIIAEQTVAGIVLIVLSIGLLVLKILTTPKAKEIDQQVLEEREKMNEHALSKHGLTADQVQQVEPFTLGGYMHDNLDKNVKNVARGAANIFGAGELADAVMSAIEDGAISGIQYRTEKGIKRSSAAEFTIFQFSENQVFVYTRQFSLISDEEKEASSEFFYRDITSISTEKTKYGINIFKINVSGGESKEIPYDQGDDMEIQPKLTAFRQLIRDKKNA